jgi:putative N6-adenine-specific DNA methylase
LTAADFFKTDKKQIPAGEKMLLLFNPPYGKRLKIDKEAFFEKIGKHLKLHYKGCDALVIVPDEEAEKAMNIYYEKKWVFKNGGLRVAALFFRL